MNSIVIAKLSTTLPLGEKQTKPQLKNIVELITSHTHHPLPSIILDNRRKIDRIHQMYVYFQKLSDNELVVLYYYVLVTKYKKYIV